MKKFLDKIDCEWDGRGLSWTFKLTLCCDSVISLMD